LYLDPSAGKIGASLETVFGAATSGALKVDPSTGEATMRFLNDIEEMVGTMGRQVATASTRTPLGGGFGEKVGEFNQRLAAGDADSAQELLSRFAEELKLLKNAVLLSMRNYVAMDAANSHTVAAAGSAR
jgi:hypothetical protein